MWRDFFGTAFAIEGETLFLREHFPEGEGYLLPMGGELAQSVARLEQHCASQGQPLRFVSLVKEEVAMLEQLVPVQPQEMDTGTDYLYRAQDLATLSGKRYNGQRNHINAFLREHPDWTLQPLDGAILPRVISFFHSLTAQENKESAYYAQSLEKTLELLHHYDRYGLDGSVLVSDGEIRGFAVGEVLGDTLFVHIERSDRACRGAAQMMVKTYSEKHYTKGVAYINREDDAGIEGLRTAKLAYHPCELLTKYAIVWPQKREQ